jgi:hypothetical protein
MKWYRRIVEPLGLPYDFELEQDVVADFHDHPAKLHEVEEWIDYGGVDLRVFSIESYLSADDLAMMKDHMFIRSEGGGTFPHQYLIALTWLYLRAKDPSACRRGGRRCEHAMGWGDACIPNANYYAECGTMRWDKLHGVLAAGETLLVVPYPASHPFRPGPPGGHAAFEFRPKGKILSYSDRAQWEADAAARAAIVLWPEEKS